MRISTLSFAFAIVGVSTQAVCLSPQAAFAQSSPNPDAAPGAPGADMTDASSVSLAKAHVIEMLKTGQADESWFSPSFLAQIPITEVDSVIGSVLGLAGTLKYVEGTKSPFTAKFTKGSDKILIRLDSDKKIDYLLFKPVQ